MTVKVALEFSDADLDYYRKAIDDAWQRNATRQEKEILDGVRQMLAKADQATAPEYVRKRLDDLGTLVSMLEDPEWAPELEDKDRRRILAAVSYFADPEDIIPDQIPGLGFLDDALLAELVMQELEHELDGYREFCEYRKNEETLRGKTHVSRADWLAAKRRQFFLRIKRRQDESRRHSSTEGPTDPILRYRY
jgi:uncharacterized membrane protein YkvA (DUF1232 family)